jgi:hypothetical protein
VLCNVRCKYIDAEDCILVNVTADRIVARPGSIVYNIVDESEDGLDLNHGQVLAGVFSDDGSQIIMRSATTIDGGNFITCIIISHILECTFVLSRSIYIYYIYSIK